MATPEDSRPAYVGPDWTAAPQGYRFLRPPPGEPATGEPATASGEWSRLLGIFHAAREGRFDQVLLLPDLIRNSTDQHLRLAAIRLLGDACPFGAADAVAEFLTDPDESIRLASYSAAACTGSLEAARLLTRHGSTLRRGIERDLLADGLAEMLDDEGSDRLLEPPEYAPFATAVMERILKIESETGSNTAILFGRPMDVRSLVHRIEHLASMHDPDQYLDLTEHYALRFESMTGFPIHEWFGADETLNLHRALDALQSFEADTAKDRFAQGKRYFFGFAIDV